jgi:hypothetical protein
MDESTRIEIQAGIDRIRTNVVQLLVETEDLSRKLDGDPPGPGGSSAPASPPSDAVGGELDSGKDIVKIEVSELPIEHRGVMSVRGYGDFTSLAFDPYVSFKLFRPEDPEALLQPVFELADLSHASRLPARMRMLGNAPVGDAWIVGPGTSGAVEEATRNALEGHDDLVPDRLQFLGYDEK